MGKAHAILSEDEDDITSLQALINILRKPHEVSCTECWGTGTRGLGHNCIFCNGSGRRLSARTDY